jgi:hypothetical protein
LLFFVGRNDIGEHDRIFLCLVVAIDAAVTGDGIPLMNNDDDGDDDDTKTDLIDAITNRTNVFVLISAHAYLLQNQLCMLPRVNDGNKNGNMEMNVRVSIFGDMFPWQSVLYPKNAIVLLYNANSSTACMFFVVTSFLRLK